MAIVYVGIDLAKNVFAVYRVDEHGKPALVRPKVARDKPHERVAALPPCRPARSAWKPARAPTTGRGYSGIWATRCG